MNLASALIILALCVPLMSLDAVAASRSCERAQARFDLAHKAARADVDRLRRDAARHERSDEKLNAKARETNRRLKSLFSEIRRFRGQKLTRRFKTEAIRTLNAFRDVARELGRLQNSQASNMRRDRAAMERLQAVAHDLDRHAEAFRSQCREARIGNAQRWATEYQSRAQQQLRNLDARLAHNRKTRAWLRDQDDWAREVINKNR